MNRMKYYKITQYVWLKMRDFEVKNAKIFWGGLSPPQTPPNNEEGDTPSSNSYPQCREGSNFLSFIPPHQRILDPSLVVIIIMICLWLFVSKYVYCLYVNVFFYICSFHSKSWQVYKRKASAIADALQKEFEDFKVEMNKTSPRRGSFELVLSSDGKG